MATTKITGTGLGLPTADGAALGGASNEWSDLYLAESGVIYFGADQDVTVTHDPDDGLFLKSIATTDNNPVLLTLQTGETDIAADDVIGKIAFQAPDEGTGTDAILVAAAIQAVSEGDFSASNNATKLSFMTGASEAAAEKMSLSSAGLLTVTGGVTMTGATPTLTIGDAGAEDAKIVFDGNAQDFHIGLDDTADDLVIGKGSALGTTTHMAFTEDGEVTKPLQPCVLLTVPSKIVNVGGSDTQTDIAWGTEIFDIGANFATPSFTAPVTGKYFMSAQVGLAQCDTDATFYQLYAVASNRTHYMGMIAPNYLFSADASHMITATQVIDMDASDTLKIQLSQNDGASQTDIETSSYFSIYLVAQNIKENKLWQ